MEIDGYINTKKIVTNLPNYEVANSKHSKNEFEKKHFSLRIHGKRENLDGQATWKIAQNHIL